MQSYLPCAEDLSDHTPPTADLNAFATGIPLLARSANLFMALALSLLLLACGDGSDTAATEEDASEDLTVVVEADKSQILQQEEKLRADQDSLKRERERLAAARHDVLNKISSLSKKDRKQRKDLEAEQARLATDEERLRRRLNSFERDRAALERKKTDLIESISALTGNGRAGNLSRRIHAVERRQREILEGQAKNERLLTEIREIVRELRNSGGTRTVVVANQPGGGGPAFSRGQVSRLEAGIRTKMKAKGVLDADLPPAARDYRSTGQRAAKNRDWPSAHNAFTRLDTIVSNLKVDHAFVQAKFRRINKSYEGKMKGLDDKKKNKVLALLDDVSDSFSDGRYDRANRKINQIHSLLDER
jgi:DNA repair exonuclease SbcCD ATPase subunit